MQENITQLASGQKHFEDFVKEFSSPTDGGLVVVVEDDLNGTESLVGAVEDDL